MQVTDVQPLEVYERAATLDLGPIADDEASWLQTAGAEALAEIRDQAKHVK